MIRRFLRWFLGDPPPPEDCPSCDSLTARLAEVRTFYEDALEFQREQIRALQGAAGAPMARPLDADRPRPRPSIRLSPWANSAVADGHVDLQAQRQQAERDWRAAGGGGASKAKHDATAEALVRQELIAQPPKKS